MSRAKQQLEEILDTVTGPRASIIVQVSKGGAETRNAAKSSYDVLRNRSMITQPADCLPPPFADLIGDTPVPKRRGGSLTTNSLAHSVAARRVRPISPSTYASDHRESLSKAVSALPQTLKATKPVLFWSAGAFSLTLKRDDLARQSEALSKFDGIYLNRRVAPPRFARAAKAAASSAGVDGHAATWGLERSGALNAWAQFGSYGQTVKVAVLDTGIDAAHPALDGRVVDWIEFDDRGAPIRPRAAVDSGEHGTHVAGTIAGGGSGGGRIGMAPRTELFSVKVLDAARGGTEAQVLAGIDWALGHGADVINMSLGGLHLDALVPTTYQTALVRAFRAGVAVVVAIGNNGHQTSGTPGNDFFALSVGALDNIDRCAAFSGGRTHIVEDSPFLDPDMLPLVYQKPDLSAPGVAVYSCVPGRKWDTFSGTSMATPHVSGAIAQLLSVTRIRDLPGPVRSSVIRDLLVGSCSELGEAGQDQRFGFGRLDIYRAIDHAFARGYGLVEQ